jgi:hypothetical protein
MSGDSLRLDFVRYEAHAVLSAREARGPTIERRETQKTPPFKFKLSLQSPAQACSPDLLAPHTR